MFSTQSCLDEDHVHDLNLLKAVNDLENAGSSDVKSCSFSHHDNVPVPGESTKCKIPSETTCPDNNLSEMKFSNSLTHPCNPIIPCNNNTDSIPNKCNKRLLPSTTSISTEHSLKRKRIDISNDEETSGKKESCFNVKNQNISLDSSKKCDLNTLLTSAVSFKTASNKPLSISSKALEKANAILSSIQDPSSCDSAITKHETETFSHSNSKNNIHHVGFKTASNRSLTVSNAAWNKGQKLISSFQTEDCSVPSRKNDNSTNQTSLSDLNNKNKSFASNKRFSFNGTSSVTSPLFKPVKAKRRNSLYKPPRKRMSLQELSSSTNNNSNFIDGSLSGKRKLGLKHDQESQICVSDESLLKAVALFEDV